MAKYIDLTAEMFNGAPTMAMDPKIDITWHCSLDTLGYNLSRMTMSTHQGTHMDAQRHFFNDGETIDQISLDRCITRAFKIDLPNKGPKSVITVENVEPYADKFEKGLNVVLNTAWDKVFPKPEFATDFPVFDRKLADWFVEKKVGLVGMDMPTPGGDWQYTHLTMLGAGIIIVEGLANLNAVTADEFTLITLPLKLKGKDGSPIRAVAIED